jgi:hypothetical protein
MGAYNEVLGTAECPRCHNTVETSVQFKYGSTVHDVYRLGDTLVWGANDIGVPGAAKVVVDGEGGICPSCGFNGDWPILITVHRDKLMSLSPPSAQYDFSVSGEGFIVLQA